MNRPCPDCGQELSETTERCPRCGCHAAGKRLELARQAETNTIRFKRFISIVLKGKYSPFYYFFSIGGDLTRHQFMLARIYLVAVYYLLSLPVREKLITIPLEPKRFFLGLLVVILLLDLPVLWKRIRTVDWYLLPSFGMFISLEIIAFLDITLISLVSGLLWLILNAVLLAIPEHIETSNRS